MPTVANTQTKSKDERTPLPGKKLLGLLAEAGPRGCTTVALAQQLYHDTDYPARDRANQLVQNLRRRGHKILTVKDAGFLAARYVLAEFVVTGIQFDRAIAETVFWALRETATGEYFRATSIPLTGDVLDAVRFETVEEAAQEAKHIESVTTENNKLTFQIVRIRVEVEQVRP